MPPTLTPTPTSSARLRWFALVVLALLLAIYAWYPMLGAFPKTQGGDGPVFHKMIEAGRVSVVRYHEMPMWNPYECGGLPLWDNPQAPLGSPLMWPIYWLGTTKTIGLWYIAHAALGFLGMWWLARRELGVSRAGAFVSAGAWAFCGFFQNHLPGGHMVFAAFEYFPVAILFWRGAEKDLRMAIGLGATVALMIYEGGVYPIPHLAVILFVETLTRVWPPKRLGRIALAGVVVLAVAITVGAARFLPVIDQIKSHTRGVASESDGLNWGVFKEVFLTRTHERPVPGQRYVWGEYGLYLGPIVLLLSIIGIGLAGLEHVWLVVLLVVSLVFMFGDAGKYAPWTILRGHVFPFKDMRVPSRFGLEVSMALTAFAGLAVDRIVARAKKITMRVDWVDALRVAVIGIAFVGVGDIIGVGLDLVGGSWGNPPEDPRIEASPRLYLGSRAPNMIDGPRENLGRQTCWEEWGFGQGAPLWDGDVPQARARDEGAVVTNVVRTQNTFTADVDTSAPARIVFDTSYDKGWRTTVGAVVDEDKALAVDVPAGKHHLVVKYWPKTMTLGLVLTGIGTVASIAALVWLTRRRRATAVSTSA
jgi:hypothetical protein